VVFEKQAIEPSTENGYRARNSTELRCFEYLIRHDGVILNAVSIRFNDKVWVSIRLVGVSGGAPEPGRLNYQSFHVWLDVIEKTVWLPSNEQGMFHFIFNICYYGFLF
jgi:hypothetical protein